MLFGFFNRIKIISMNPYCRRSFFVQASTFITKLGCRSYAEVTIKDKLTITLASPYQSFMKDEGVDQVNLSTTSGSIGILHKHVPTIQQLKPGVIEVIGGQGNNPTKLFASGGFAIMDQFSRLCVSVAEAYPLDSFSSERLTQMIHETQMLQSKATSEEDKAALDIQLEVYNALKPQLVK